MPEVLPDDPSVEAWISIVAAYKTVHVLLNQQLVRSNLTFSQYRVIRALGKSGAMPMSKIGEHMLVTPGNMTGLVDRLEGRGYIERIEDGDRRITRIGLTRKGRAVYQQTSAEHGRLVSRIMRVLTRDEQLNVAQLLHRVKEAALKERSSARNESD